MPFDQLGLCEPLLRAVRDEGYSTTTPIQAKAIPPVLDGCDLLGCAQTGTGKTAAFALPILDRLSRSRPTRPGRPIRCLVLVPTRELALQVGESFRNYGRHLHITSTVIFGGVGQHPQVQALKRGVDIVVACPGRLLDLIGQGHVKLDAVEVLVLDEADRMLDMGFLPDMRRVVALIPRERQTLLFSATMPTEIRQLALQFQRQPVEVSVAPVATAAETVDQRVYHVSKVQKQALLNHLLADRSVVRALVFTRTKHGADKVVKQLARIHIGAEAIHGNKSQNARQRALESFRAGVIRVLVASDIAARGLDIDGITHVVNFDIPNEPETYVHRIGRTGRAGATGIALSLCDHEEKSWLLDIERTMRRRVPVAPLPTFAPLPPAPPPLPGQYPPPGGRPGSRGGRPDTRRPGQDPHRSGHRQPGQRGHHGQRRDGNQGRPQRDGGPRVW
jgi:ATP-dependent RNA helicase RhlE